MTGPREELLGFLSEKANTPSDINEHLELFYRIMSETRAQKIVDLGTRDGNSTYALVIDAVETGDHVTSVDNGKAVEYTNYRTGLDALAETSVVISDKFGLDMYWTLVIKDDIEFAAQYTDEFELLLIGTVHSHEQTKKELEIWESKVVSGGFIVIHDIVSFREQNLAIWGFLDWHSSLDYVEHTNCNRLGIIISGRDMSALKEAAKAVRPRNPALGMIGSAT